MSQSVSDDSADFSDFVASSSRAMLRSAWLLTGDAARAEDLLQTALARLWPRWRRVADGGNPEAYLRRMLYTTYLSWWRRRWRDEIATADLPDLPDARDVGSEVTGREAVRAALAALSPQQRAVIVLRFVDDRSVEETAQQLGCSSATVKTHSARALAALRANPALAPSLEGI